MRAFKLPLLKMDHGTLRRHRAECWIVAHLSNLYQKAVRNSLASKVLSWPILVLPRPTLSYCYIHRWVSVEIAPMGYMYSAVSTSKDIQCTQSSGEIESAYNPYTEQSWAIQMGESRDTFQESADCPNKPW